MARPDPDGVRLLTLQAELRYELGRLDRVVRETAGALATHAEADPELVVVHGVGGLVHDFYTGCEKLLVRIERAFGSSTPDGPDWHRDLLHRARLAIPGLRPAILDGAAVNELDGLRRFRHLYRNLYAFDLEWARVRELAGSLAGTWARVRPSFERFLDVVMLLADEHGGRGEGDAPGLP